MLVGDIMRSSRDISGELVLDISKLSCCRYSHYFRWRNHCSLAAYSAYAKALRRKHCFCHWQGGLSLYVQPPPQGQGSCSEAAFTYSSILPNAAEKSLSQLWISELLYFHPNTFCVFVSPSAKLIFPLSLSSQPIIRVWICSSFKLGSVGARAFCNKMPLQRSPDTAMGKVQWERC